MGIRNPTETAKNAFETSRTGTSVIVDAIKGKGPFSMLDHINQFAKTISSMHPPLLLYLLMECWVKSKFLTKKASPKRKHQMRQTTGASQRLVACNAFFCNTAWFSHQVEKRSWELMMVLDYLQNYLNLINNCVIFLYLFILLI